MRPQQRPPPKDTRAGCPLPSPPVALAELIVLETNVDVLNVVSCVVGTGIGAAPAGVRVAGLVVRTFRYETPLVIIVSPGKALPLTDGVRLALHRNSRRTANNALGTQDR